MEHEPVANAAIVGDPVEDSRQHRENNSWWIEPPAAKNVVHQIAVQAAIAIFERVHKYESKCQRCRGDGWIKMICSRPVKSEHAGDEGL